jgi:hypothetical protein
VRSTAIGVITIYIVIEDKIIVKNVKTNNLPRGNKFFFFLKKISFKERDLIKKLLGYDNSFLVNKKIGYWNSLSPAAS